MTQGTIKRDRWDRPLILQPDGKEEGYTRVTTFAGSLEDQSGIAKWKQRLTAIGLADRPDLLLSVAAHRDDKKELGKITEQALEAGGASTAANKGTAVHILTEMRDRGEELPVVAPEIKRDLDLYTAATAGMKVAEIEKFLVCDSLKAAGTADRIFEFGGQRYIGDLKTGSVDLGIVKIATQLSIYSRSAGYNEDTGERYPINVNQDWGIVIHLPVGVGEINLYWIDLNKGWDAAWLCKQVREFRKLKMRDLTHLISSSQEAAA